MLRFISEMVAAPLIRRPQARYVPWRGSARISWFSRANTSEKTCGMGGLLCNLVTWSCGVSVPELNEEQTLWDTLDAFLSICRCLDTSCVGDFLKCWPPRAALFSQLVYAHVWKQWYTWACLFNLGNRSRLWARYMTLSIFIHPPWQPESCCLVFSSSLNSTISRNRTAKVLCRCDYIFNRHWDFTGVSSPDL